MFLLQGLGKFISGAKFRSGRYPFSNWRQGETFRQKSAQHAGPRSLSPGSIARLVTVPRFSVSFKQQIYITDWSQSPRTGQSVRFTGIRADTLPRLRGGRNCRGTGREFLFVTVCFFSFRM
jgi:hypothetical protein